MQPTINRIKGFLEGNRRLFQAWRYQKMVIFKMLREGEVGSCGLARYRDGKVGFGMTSRDRKMAAYGLAWYCVLKEGKKNFNNQQRLALRKKTLLG